MIVHVPFQLRILFFSYFTVICLGPYFLRGTPIGIPMGYSNGVAYMFAEVIHASVEFLNKTDLILICINLSFEAFIHS